MEPGNQFADYIFHGTTPERAESIHAHGFDDLEIGTSNGSSAGPGHYFASTHDGASRYGPSVVRARLNDVEVHPNPYMDRDVRDEMQKVHSQNPTPPGVDHEEWKRAAVMPQALRNLRYGGHVDPDDSAIVIMRGRDVSPVRD